jgi:preprotein translocase subunit SecA
MLQVLFGDPNEKKITRYTTLVNQVNYLEKNIKQLSDKELQDKTIDFTKKLSLAPDFKDILPEVFAIIREASFRVLGLRHFDVQLIGGIILHEGKIAEMKTGEGKTLVAILPAYLNALSGLGVHVVTVNDYLAKRDSEWVGQVPKFLGLSVGLVLEGMTQQQRKENYSKDITYTTNSELGFDYLRDNMSVILQDIVQRPFNFCILDEVDSILIDEARTPLIISGAIDSLDEKYNRANELSLLLKRNIDYEIDEKARNVILTDNGIVKCEQMLNGLDLYDVLNPWAPYILNSIKAKELFIKDVHYIVKDEEIIIVDEFTGRIMEGRRWSDGLHQSIEAKEHLPIQSETQTLASITYQNFFLLYPKLSGMTGTAKTEEAELDKIYSLEVVSVPTHRPMSRRDMPDLIYKNQYAKWRSVADECLDMHALGRPVLIGTTSVEKSELLSSLLKEYGIPHKLQNAKTENLKREAEIIAQAGRKGAVTIATNMAGRGTDILLGGNANYIARNTISLLLTKNLFNDELSKDSQLSNLFSFLYEKIDSAFITDKELEYKLSIACEKGFTEDRLVITLRAAYQVLVEKYDKLIDLERQSVVSIGGLHVIGTERHESRRVDNQLRGRSGRQGDPGSSRFFLSLEDNLLRIFGGDRISNLMDALRVEEDVPIESNLLNSSLESAQKKVEAYYYDARKQLFDYDEVLNYQRQAIYSERRRVLESINLRDWVIQYAEATIFDLIQPNSKQNINLHDYYFQQLNEIEDLLGLPYPLDVDYFLKLSTLEAENFLCKQVRIAYDLKESQIELIEDGLMRELERSFLLQKIDSAWKEHLQSMNALRETIAWRGYGQKDPLIEYKNEAYVLFTSMISNIRHSVTYLIFRSQPILKV